MITLPVANSHDGVVWSQDCNPARGFQELRSHPEVVRDTSPAAKCWGKVKKLILWKVGELTRNESHNERLKSERCFAAFFLFRSLNCVNIKNCSTLRDMSLLLLRKHVHDCSLCIIFLSLCFDWRLLKDIISALESWIPSLISFLGGGQWKYVQMTSREFSKVDSMRMRKKCLKRADLCQHENLHDNTIFVFFRRRGT